MQRFRLLVTALFALVLALGAWVHDDAYITFRTVDNIVAGNGPVWNPAERVQTFTHPLWMLLHVPFRAMGAPIYETTLLLSVAASLGAFVLLLQRVARRGDGGRTAALAGLTALASRTFVDFSTSGLENPLTHLLLALLALAVLDPGGRDRRLAPVAIVAGLLAFVRLDALLLALPALAVAWWGRHRSPSALLRRSAIVGAAFSPLVGWLLFATVYYGDPVPNTALAKLGPGIPLLPRLLRGAGYVLGGFANEPILLVALVGAAVAARRRRELRSLVAGSFLYVVYTVWIGGGYMHGRFLSAPFFLAVLVLSRVDLAGRCASLARRRPAVVTAVLVGVLVRGATAHWWAPWTLWSAEDERRRFHRSTGWVVGLGQERWPDHYFRAKGEYLARCGPPVVVDAYVGFLGHALGERAHVVDLLGLTDPLLARLPTIVSPGVRDSPEAWRPGHFPRPLPAGYLESLATGENRLEDPALSAVYEDVRLLSRAPLGDPERVGAALRLARRPDPRVRDWASRHRDLLDVAPADVAESFVPRLAVGRVMELRGRADAPCDAEWSAPSEHAVDEVPVVASAAAGTAFPDARGGRRETR